MQILDILYWMWAFLENHGIRVTAQERKLQSMFVPEFLAKDDWDDWLIDTLKLLHYDPNAEHSKSIRSLESKSKSEPQPAYVNAKIDNLSCFFCF